MKLKIDILINFEIDILLKTNWHFDQIIVIAILIFLSKFDNNIKNSLLCSTKV